MKNILALFLLVIYSCNLYAKEIIQGKVIKVTDGDTITLLTNNNKQVKIRLYGIDCPEKKQDYYQVAKDFVSNRIYNTHVKVEVINKDRYQRSVGVVWDAQKTNLNLSLLKEGLAWHYKDFDKSVTYALAENEAQKSKINIWSLKNPIAPWDFRKSKRNNQKKQ